MADAIAKFNLMQGHITLLNTGTDEHGNKVQQAAKKLNLPIDHYCNNVSQRFRDMCDVFDVGYTTFIRTTEPHHHEAVQNFWVLIL